MASPAHELGVCFLHGSDYGPDEYLFPLPVIEKTDDDYTSQMRSDVSAAEQVDPSAFKPVVKIERSEEVPVGSKFLNMSDGAQAVGGRLGVRCVAGSVIADGQVTARDQKVWLNRNDEFTLDGELASVTEESLGDNRGFIESRDQKHVCVACCKGQSSSLFPESSPRMQMDRGEVEIELARQTRTRRASILITDMERNEYEVMRVELLNWCNSCAKGRAKHSHGCPTSEPSGSLVARDCRVSSRSVNENSPTVLVLFERTHGVKRGCQVSHEATEPHAVDCLPPSRSSMRREGSTGRKSEVFTSVGRRGRGYCAKDRKPSTNS